MSDLESVSSSSSEEEIIIEPPKPKRKGRGKSKPESVETLLKEEIIDAKPIRGRGKKTIDAKIKEEKSKTLEPPPAPAPEKKKRAKKVKVEPVPAQAEEPDSPELPAHMGGEPEKPVKKARAKRVLTEEQRAKQLEALAKGRATRIANAKKKKEEREKFVEDLKVKIAEPVVKETIIREVAPAQEPVSVQRNGKRSASVPVQAPVQGKQALRFV